MTDAPFTPTASDECLGECGRRVRPVGPPATTIEALTGERCYCLACLMATCARSDPDND